MYFVDESTATLEGLDLGRPTHVEPNPTIGAVPLPARGVLAIGQAMWEILDPAEYRRTSEETVGSSAPEVTRPDLRPPTHLRLSRTGYGVEVIEDQVLEIEPGFFVHLAGGHELAARCVLIATGINDTPRAQRPHRARMRDPPTRRRRPQQRRNRQAGRDQPPNGQDPRGSSAPQTRLP
jgi:hypothetical protein